MTNAVPPKPPPLPSDDVAERKPWQFSMRTMMLGMTGFAFVCALFAVLPAALSQLLLGISWLVATGWLVTGLVFATGDTRAFCIGAAVVTSSMWTGLGGRFTGGIQSIIRGIPLSWGQTAFGGSSVIEIWIVHVALAASAIANGYLCIRARRYFERHASD